MHDIRVHEKNVIMIGTTTRSERCGKRYIIYRSERRKDGAVFINTSFYRTDGCEFMCCSPYGGLLCGSEEELRAMSVDELESAAYNKWMNGAR